MPPKKYTDKQRITFLALAAQVGAAKAVAELGYPTEQVGRKWMKEHAVHPPTASPLLTAARRMQDWYSVNEKRLAAQLVLDRAYTLLTEGVPKVDDQGQTHMVPLDPRDLNALANSINKTVATLQLLEGRATEIVESQATTSPELLELINEYRDRNRATVTNLRAV